MFSFRNLEKPEFLPLKYVFRHRRLRKNLRPEYVEACRFFACPLIDRTETLDAGIEFTVLDPLHNLAPTELDFEEICFSRGAQIAEKASFENRKIQILWSGGIDSTLALASLYRVLREKDDLARLEILLSDESISEFSTFFEKIIKPELDYTIFNPPIHPFLDPAKIIVTGEHGDQLFGSDKAKYYILAKEAFRPYREVLPFMMARKFGSRKNVAAVIKYLEPQIEKSPVAIETLYDYLWWMNFSLKWQHVALRLIYQTSPENFALNENVFNFFSARDFQAWSISNHSRKIKKTWNSYKYVAKEAIFRFHPDRDYLINKEKEPSLKDAILKTNSFLELIKRPFKRAAMKI